MVYSMADRDETKSDREDTRLEVSLGWFTEQMTQDIGLMTVYIEGGNKLTNSEAACGQEEDRSEEETVKSIIETVKVPPLFPLRLERPQREVFPTWLARYVESYIEFRQQDPGDATVREIQRLRLERAIKLESIYTS